MYKQLYESVLFPVYIKGIQRRRTLEYLRELEDSQYWPGERIERLQLARLQTLVSRAYATCPYYRETWKTLGLKPEDLRTLADFRHWPLLSRQNLQQRYNDLCSSSANHLVRSSTGGSTGEPVQFAFDSDSAQRRAAMTHRGYAWAGATPGAKRLYIWGTALGKVSWPQRGKDWIVSRVKRQRVLSCFQFTPKRMRGYLRDLNRYRPEVIVAYTNPLYEFARFLDENGLHPVSPRAIVVGAERLYDFQREQIQSVFQAPVFETYGSREFLLIAAECSEHRGLHVSAENLLVEIVDDNGMPTATGEQGRVVITDLTNFGMPFIRYAIGDLAIAGGEACPCGRGLPLLQGLRGRQLDTIVTPDGRRLPGEFFPHLFKDYAQIRRLQVMQADPSQITIKLVAQPPLSPAELDHLERQIREASGPQLRITFRFVDDIPLTANGKLQVVVRSDTAASRG